MYLQKEQTRVSADDARKLWLEAVDALIENAELRRRIEFLERQLVINSFGGYQTH